MHFFILCISIVGVRIYTETERGVFVSMLQCFRQCSMCVKLLSPLIFCLLCFNWHMCNVKWHILPNSEEQASNQIHRVSSGYQGWWSVVILNTT